MSRTDSPALPRWSMSRAAVVIRWSRRLGRVEAVGRLVQEQDIRIPQQGSGQPEALARAEREPAHPPARGASQSSLARTSSTRLSGKPLAVVMTRS
jgi:hypothetical protein